MAITFLKPVVAGCVPDFCVLNFECFTSQGRKGCAQIFGFVVLGQPGLHILDYIGIKK